MEKSSKLRVWVRLTLSSALLILTASFGVLVLGFPQGADAAAAQTIPYLINFQGRLTDNDGNVLGNGSYNIKFRLYNVASGGTALWEEDHVYGTSDNRVSVQNGLFDIQLGSLTTISPSLFNEVTQGSLYLEVELPTPATATCASNGCAVWTEGAMTPRQPLSSSPYAFNAQLLDGLDSTAFGQLAATNTWSAANLFEPTTASTVALTVAASTAGGSDALDIKSASGVQTANFDTNGAFNTTTVNSLTSGGTVTTDAATLQRVATGTFTLDLSDSSATTLAVTNSGTGLANLNVVKGDFETAGVSRLTNTGNLQNIVNITQSGTYLSQNTTDSTAAMEVLSASSSGSRAILQVGTSNTQVSMDANLIVNSSVARPQLTSVSFASNSGGSLSGAAGTTYYYVISAITAGGETARSVEDFIPTSSFSDLSAPIAPTASAPASGGSLTANANYYYEVTYVTSNGETIPSLESNLETTTTSKDTITVTVPTYTGAATVTARKLYRTDGNGSAFYLVNTGTSLQNNTTTSFTDTTADTSLGAAAPTTNTATTNQNQVTLTFQAYTGATSYRIYRGTSSLGENAYQTTGACTSPCTFTDTGAAGTAATPITPTAGMVGIGTTAPTSTLTVEGNISSSNGYVENGHAGQTTSCGVGSTLSGLTVSGGIITAAGGCASIGGGSASATLQTAYNNSTVPQIVLSSAGGALTVRDAATALGTNLFVVQDNAGANNYLAVASTGLSTTGSMNIGSGQTYQIGGTQISTSNLSNGSSITLQGNTFNGASQLVQLNSSTQLPAVSGTNLTNLNPTSLSTGSGAVTLASAAGTGLTLNSASGTLGLGSATATLQAAAGSFTIDLPSNTAATTLAIRNSGTGGYVASLSVTGGLTIGSGQAITVGTSTGSSAICASGQYLDSATYAGGVVTGGTCANVSAGSGASTSLNNLTTTSINQSLIPQGNTLSLGAAATVWQDTYTTSLDAGTAAGYTTLSVGTTNATAVTLGQAGFQVSTPGGINAGSGNFTTTGNVDGGELNFQPSTDIAAAVIKQSSIASPTADIFDLQTANSTNLIQATSTGALTLNSPTALTVTAGAASTWSTSSGTLTISAGSGYSLILGTAANGLTLNATTNEPSLTGTAQHTRSVSFAPEYANATLAASGSNNSGNMTASFCSNGVGTVTNVNTSVCATGQQHNYYQWTPTVASPAQTYDVYLRYQLPSDFASLSSLSMFGWVTSTTSDAVTLSLYDASGALCGTATDVGTTAGGWPSSAVAYPSFTGCTFAAGDTVLLKVDLSATSASDYARAGEITLTYKSKW